MSLAARQHDRDIEFLVYREQISRVVAHYRSTEVGNGPLGVGNDFRVKLAQKFVDLQKLVIAVGGKAHRLVGTDQASKTMDICGG